MKDSVKNTKTTSSPLVEEMKKYDDIALEDRGKAILEAFNRINKMPDVIINDDNEESELQKKINDNKNMQIIDKNFEVGNIAYVIEDIYYPTHAYPVKVLEVNKTNIITTAPPLDLRCVCVGYRNKYVFRKLPYGNDQGLYLEKETCPITRLESSIKDVCQYKKYKKIRIEDFSYSTSNENDVEHIPYYENNMNYCLKVHMGKMGMSRSEIADLLEVSIGWLNSYLRNTIIVTEDKKNKVKKLLTEFGYEIQENKGE